MNLVEHDGTTVRVYGTSGDDTFEFAPVASWGVTDNGVRYTFEEAELSTVAIDGDTGNDPVVVSVRGASHYGIGHIPGAINIPWRAIAKEENLQKLPTDRQIVVYCYTGHTGAVATTALNMRVIMA